MPINCPKGGKARFRVNQTDKGQVRLAFCGNEVVEAKKLKSAAKEKKKLGS
jgi:hypothetical protein